MTVVKSDRLQYCTDDFGNPIYARVCWEPDTSTPKPIGKYSFLPTTIY